MRSIVLPLFLLGATACTDSQADTHTTAPAPAPAPAPTGQASVSPSPATNSPATTSPSTQALSTPELRGLAFAREHCTACHAVEANGTSPNPESPPFADIANRPGVTAKTLAQFLRDSHNYPEAMNFRVESGRINDLADYMLTLRQPGYRPSI